jgi:glycosyltransferase involved in cell wall biosynthesis
MTKNIKNPLVSVIMPVYNAGNFLYEAIESILNQTYKNIELIIIDDASTDNSWEIISAYKRQFPGKIKTIRLEENLNKGGDAAANVGVRLAHGQFIARMDADDIAVLTRLEKQVRFLQKHPEVSLVGSCAYIIDKQGQVVGEKKVPKKHKDIYKEYFVFHPIIHPTVMIRREVLTGKSLYKIDYESNNDYLTFFRMISEGMRFANLPEKLVYYRIHGKNDSLMNIKRTFVNTLRIRCQAVTKFGYRPTVFSLTKLLAQIVLALLLPEKILFNLYLITRGISKPKVTFVKLRYALGV